MTSHAAYLAEQVAAYQRYLEHTDPGARLVGLHAIHQAVDSCFALENDLKASVPDAAPESEPHWVLELVRRFLP